MPVAELTEPELAAWGDAFGKSLSMPACVVLEGDLGAGKTTLVRAIARAQGALDPITSPTFSLVHEYHAPRGQVFHLDLYRLSGPDQLAQLGWEDIVRAGGLMIVEWPDRAGDALPEDRIRLRLEHVSGRPDVRRLTW